MKPEKCKSHTPKRARFYWVSENGPSTIRNLGMYINHSNFLMLATNVYILTLISCAANFQHPHYTGGDYLESAKALFRNGIQSCLFVFNYLFKKKN